MIPKDKLDMLQYYNKGLELYKQRQFQEARKYFAKCLEMLPGDGPSQLYVERCDAFIKTPPPENWDGVFTMTTK
ncbi:MAG: hypothetical protein A2Y33_06925 [Spirochaetes bacterium GWF1_51_8]|nr:MAG: hypothetical protein A2Y33_06925 [Spirochaetes bacterium GWF1_51_8]